MRKRKPEEVKIDVDSQDCGWLIVGPPKGQQQEPKPEPGLVTVTDGEGEREGPSKGRNSRRNPTAVQGSQVKSNAVASSERCPQKKKETKKRKLKSESQRQRQSQKSGAKAEQSRAEQKARA